jgi:hypothetical protein
MGSFEDLMNERRRLQKELDEKSSRDEYTRQLEATLVMDESPVVVSTSSPSPVDISSTPAFSMAVEGGISNVISTFFQDRNLSFSCFCSKKDRTFLILKQNSGSKQNVFYQY